MRDPWIGNRYLNLNNMKYDVDHFLSFFSKIPGDKFSPKMHEGDKACYVEHIANQYAYTDEDYDKLAKEGNAFMLMMDEHPDMNGKCIGDIAEGTGPHADLPMKERILAVLTDIKEGNSAVKVINGIIKTATKVKTKIEQL